MQNGREGKGEEQMKGSEGGRELASIEIMKSRRLCVQYGCAAVPGVVLHVYSL